MEHPLSAKECGESGRCRDGTIQDDKGAKRSTSGGPAGHTSPGARTQAEAPQELEGIPLTNEERESYGKLNVLSIKLKYLCV